MGSYFFTNASANQTGPFLPRNDKHAERFMLVVDFPTPPFWFAIATIFTTITSSFFCGVKVNFIPIRVSRPCQRNPEEGFAVKFNYSAADSTR